MLKTRLTDALSLQHPIIQAPMALAAGGVLAGAVSNAGALGMIGGGFGDAAWIEAEFANAGGAAVGCGFITWSVAGAHGVLDEVLSRNPKALFLSFGDPEPLAKVIQGSGTKLICQVQNLEDARRAIASDADVIVAQGGEAGGHGELRGTMSFVPEVADLIAAKSQNTLLCAAGGIGDGRGLAAALMLGADGVVMGSRFWASKEALVHPNMHRAAEGASGDDTVRTRTMDVALGLPWPERFTIRVLRNAFTERWDNDLDGLRAASRDEAERWMRGLREGDTETSNTIVGEVAGVIDSIKGAAQIVEETVAQAERIIARAPDLIRR